MATEPVPETAPPSPPSPGPEIPSARRLSPLGALLSYLVPGLGQIVQGRLGKGVLFLICVYTLFFYGVYLGAAEVKIGSRTYRVSSNVYIPRSPPAPEPALNQPRSDSNPIRALVAYVQSTGVSAASYPRPQFAAQFWVGIAAWPAIIQYRYAAAQPDTTSLERDITIACRHADEAKAAGNEEAAQQSRAEAAKMESQLWQMQHPLLGDFMREPGPQATNVVYNAGDKQLDLAWVFTVIAGVLNIMVICDALAGPAFASPEEARRKAG